jgi:membrane protein
MRNSLVVVVAKRYLAQHGTMLASALAYSAFFSIPSVLIVATGLFSLIASPETITKTVDHFHNLVPNEVLTLTNQALHRADSHPATSLAFTIFGFVLAVWAVTSAMTTFMVAVNVAYGVTDHRSFVRKRLVALEMAAVTGVAFAVLALLTIFGPVVEAAISKRIGSAGGVLDVIWWILQWPVLLTCLLAAFATLLYLAPDVEQPRWRFLTPGSLVAAILWIAASGLFALYTATFSSYDKTWGTLSGVIVMLTWLWLSANALLLGAEINVELELREQSSQAARSRANRPYAWSEP